MTTLPSYSTHCF